MRRIKSVLAVAVVAMVMLVALSGTAMAQGVPFDPADCESVEGQSFCEWALVDLVGGTQPIAVPVCYVIDDAGSVLAVYPGDCTGPTTSA
jgi:hypothetical protein